VQINPSRRGSGLASLAALALLVGCTQPTHDPATLNAIKAESERLIAANPGTTDVIVPKTKWPHAIAALDPEAVTVSPNGVDVLVKPHFDGGYGYFVPARDQVLPEPVERFSAIGQGVYWYRPY
jgi:hypothetical protein